MAGGPVWNGQDYVYEVDEFAAQGLSSIAVAPNGDYTILWVQVEAGRTFLMASSYSYDGTLKRPAFQVAEAFNGISSTTISYLPSGRLSIAWQEVDSSSLPVAVRTRAFDADGGPTSFDPVNTVGASSFSSSGAPEIIALSNGNYMVVWTGQAGFSSDIKYKVYSSNGLELIQERPLNTNPNNLENDVRVTAGPNGSTYVTWISQNGGSYYFSFRQVDAIGQPVGSEQSIPVSTFNAAPKDYSVTTLSDGKFLIVYTVNNGTGDILRGHIAATPGQISTTPQFSIGSGSATFEKTPVVKGMANGGFVVVWVADSPTGTDVIYAQIFNASGASQGQAFVVQNVPGEALSPSVLAHSDGRFTITWTSAETGDIRSQTFDSRVPNGQGVFAWTGDNRDDNYAGTVNHDLLNGGGGSNRIYGHDGNDTIYGGGFGDTLSGGAGNDQLWGGGGFDVFYGGTGKNYMHDGGGEFDRDTFWGIEGEDTVSYYGDVAVKVVLHNTAQNEGTAKGDEYYAIEVIDGSTQGDWLEGDQYANRFWGDAGDDVLTGNGGADTLSGGTGNDIYFVDTLDTVIEGATDADGTEDSIQATVANGAYTLAGGIENGSIAANLGGVSLTAIQPITSSMATVSPTLSMVPAEMTFFAATAAMTH
jgi:Ca2+-binding RTX toxin-like protein